MLCHVFVFERVVSDCAFRFSTLKCYMAWQFSSPVIWDCMQTVPGCVKFTPSSYLEILLPMVYILADGWFYVVAVPCVVLPLFAVVL